MQVAMSHQETHTGLFIAGERREAADEFPVFEPADPETIVGHAAAASAEQARQAVRAAHQAFLGWAELGPERRAELVRASLEPLAEDEAERVELLSREHGKVRSECEIEMQALAGRFELAAGLAGELDPIRTLDPPPARTTVTRLPLGVVSIIVPFNWPLAIMGASLPYALLAGNTAVIKTPPTTPLAFMRTFERIAGALPPGVLNVISWRDAEIGPVMIQDQLVRQVTFTGSVPAGKRIMAMAAENLTRVTLELGGNDPAPAHAAPARLRRRPAVRGPQPRSGGARARRRRRRSRGGARALPPPGARARSAGRRRHRHRGAVRARAADHPV